MELPFETSGCYSFGKLQGCRVWDLRLKLQQKPNGWNARARDCCVHGRPMRKERKPDPCHATWRIMAQLVSKVIKFPQSVGLYVFISIATILIT